MTEESTKSEPVLDLPDENRSEKRMETSHHDASGDPKPAMAKASDEQKRDQRLRPYKEKIALLTEADFAKGFPAIIKGMKADRLTRKDLQFLLGEVLLSTPAWIPAATVVKYYKEGSDWEPSEVEAALNALAHAVRVRIAHVGDLGPMVQGALIPLVSAIKGFTHKAKPLEGADGCITALIKVHCALHAPERDPLKGSPGNPVKGLIDDVIKALRLSSHPEVETLIGQRLFGFDQVFEASDSGRAAERQEAPRAATVSTQDALPKKSTPSPPLPSTSEPVTEKAPTQNSAALAKPKVSVREQEIMQRFERCEKQRGAAERSLKKSEGARADLQAGVDALNQIIEQHKLQVNELERMRERQLDRIETLEERCRDGVRVQAELDQSNILNVALQADITNLKKLLDQTKLAKTNEFDRGRAVRKAEIASHCVERLREIAQSAELFNDESRQFIKSSANSLVEYLNP
jgi:hypothetical protein